MSNLAFALLHDNQLGAAENTEFRATDCVPERGKEFLVRQSCRLFGLICQPKGEDEKVIHHFEMAIGIAPPFNWHGQLFWNYFNLAWLSRDKGGFSGADAHIGRTKAYAA